MIPTSEVWDALARYGRFFDAALLESGRVAGAGDVAAVAPAGGPPLVTDAVPEPEPAGPLLIPLVG